MTAEAPAAAPAPEQPAATPTVAPTLQDTMAAALVERGHLSQAQVDAMKQDSPTDEPMSLATLENDGNDYFFETPESPAGYVFEKVGKDLPPEQLKAACEQEGAMRQLFHAEQIPQSTAAYLDRAWAKACASPPTAEQIEAGRESTMAQLSKVWGANRDANIELARQEVTRAAQRNPRVRDMLEQSGLGNDPWLIQHLANRAMARAARSKK